MSQTRRRRSGAGSAAWVLILGCAVVVGLVRPRAVQLHQDLGKSPEVYKLPAVEHLQLMSLGYRSALADLLFGSTLVTAGIHFAERRIFEYLDHYLEAIVALEPEYRDAYYYADSLLTLSTVEMPKRNYRIARDFQEKGRRLFPDDAMLWMSSGQFVAYLAPPHLPPEEDPNEWRRYGAQVLDQGCSLWPDQTDLPYTCLSAATILSREGEMEASIESLRRLVAIADDPQVRQEAEARLTNLLSVQQAEEVRRRGQLLGELQGADLPFVSRTLYQLLGPPSQVKDCVERAEGEADASCASSFRAWDELVQVH